jgi:hypothetical protein
MGYPLAGYLFRDFELLDVEEFRSGHEMYLVKPDGTYAVVEDVAEFPFGEYSGLAPDDGVWIVDRRERLFAFRIQTDEEDVVATVRAALVDVREAFGTDLTDGIERLVQYFRHLPLPSPTEETGRGGGRSGRPDESARLIAREVRGQPPQLPGVSVMVEVVQPYSDWSRTASGELIEVRDYGQSGA